MWSLQLSWVRLSTGLSTAKPCAHMQTAATPGGIVVLQKGKTSGMPCCFMILWYAVHRPTPTLHSVACCLWGSRTSTRPKMGSLGAALAKLEVWLQPAKELQMNCQYCVQRIASISLLLYRWNARYKALFPCCGTRRLQNWQQN